MPFDFFEFTTKIKWCPYPDLNEERIYSMADYKSAAVPFEPYGLSVYPLYKEWILSPYYLVLPTLWHRNFLYS